MKQPLASVFARILTADQQTDGSFVGYSVPAGKAFEAGAKEYWTTFAPALIVGAISGVRDREIGLVRERAADWLAAQHGPQWSFNYWARQAKERKSQPYPDDWDDTSCAVIALTLARPEVVTGEVLGHLVTLLTNTEMAEGGPYRTWIVPADAGEHWQDVDVAVNANIAYLLHLHGVDLPNLEQLADERVAAGELSSPYYPSAYPIEYFVSRWYQGAHRVQLLERVLKRQRRGRWGNPLDTALAVSTCLNLGAEPAAVAEAVAWLRGLDEAAVQAEAFCMDPAVEGVKYVAGSRALTAALCLEATAKYEAARQPAGHKEPASRAGAGARGKAAGGPAERVSERVVAEAMARFEQCGGDILAAAEHMRDRLLGGTAAGQITLLPYLFRRALGENGRGISDERVVELGKISFYGWLAYTVYDDFLDEEGKPTLLSAANVAMRELVRELGVEAARRAGFGQLAWPILDRQEAANAWEVSHCRVGRQADLTRVPVPQFGNLWALAERSMGHALGCLAITMELGHEAGSAEVRTVQEFFRHYLTARQLGDDASDWKEDLLRGQINAVGAQLLEGVDRRGRSVRDLYLQLERQFWERDLTVVNEWIFRELTQARAALKKLEFIRQPDVLETLLAPVEDGARKSQSQQQQTLEFLRAYNPPKVGELPK